MTPEVKAIVKTTRFVLRSTLPFTKTEHIRHILVYIQGPERIRRHRIVALASTPSSTTVKSGEKRAVVQRVVKAAHGAHAALQPPPMQGEGEAASRLPQPWPQPC